MKTEKQKTRRCDICGEEGNFKKIQKGYGMALCKKHMLQICRHGKITDPTPTQHHFEKNKDNEITVKEEFAILKIYSKLFEKPIEVIIDTEDVPRISEKRWNIANHHGQINVFAWINNRNTKLSRYLLGYNGKLFIDHINRNTLDNRKSNLRIVTPAENAQNRTAIGVYEKTNGKWVAKIVYYGVLYHVGTFNTKQEATIARNEKMEQLLSNKENLRNEYYNKSPERNIRPSKGNKYRSYATINGKRVYIGTFDTKEEAIKARDEAEHQKTIRKGA